MRGTTASTVLVLGASGVVGTGVVAALLEAGASVLGVARRAQPLELLASRFGNDPALEVMASSVADDRHALRLSRRLRLRKSPIRAVIDCVAGPVERGRLLDTPCAQLQRKMTLDLLPHLAAARYLLPLLAEWSVGTTQAAHYVMVGATGAECGWAGYGEASVAAASQAMLAKVLHQEAATSGVRVQMLSLDHPVCQPGRDDVRWPDALSVGRRAVALLRQNDQAVKPIVRYADAWTPPPPRALPVAPQPLSSIASAPRRGADIRIQEAKDHP